MYQMLGLQRLLWAYAVVVAAIAVAIYTLRPPAFGPELGAPIGYAGTIAGFLFWLLGQTRAFPVICRLPIIKLYIPDIDGEWKGFVRSNWPRVQSHQRASEPGAPSVDTIPLLDVAVTARITARLFRVGMSLVSGNQHSESHSLAVRVRRVSDSGRVELIQVYENTNKNPSSDDQQSHFGASLLELKPDSTPPKLTGFYWTNRNWASATNTAGMLELTRQ